MALNFLLRYSPHRGWTPNMLPLGKLHDTYNKENEWKTRKAGQRTGKMAACFLQYNLDITILYTTKSSV